MQIGLVQRDIHRWKKQVFYSGSLATFINKSSTANGIYTFKEAGLFFDFLVENRGSKNTVVYFHPDIENRQEKALPFFVGSNVIGKQANFIIVSDPCLYMDQQLSLAWYAGTAACDVQAVLTHALRKLLSPFDKSRLIFTGISGGGFASLFFSHLFPGSLAIPINPQTDIRHFSFPRVAHYVRACFGQKDDRGTMSILDKRPGASINGIYSKALNNNVLYVQNISDHHVETHWTRFNAAVGQGTGRAIRPVFGFWGNGHVAPSVDQQRQLYQQVEDWDGNWTQLVREGNFSWLEIPLPPKTTDAQMKR